MNGNGHPAFHKRNEDMSCLQLPLHHVQVDTGPAFPLAVALAVKKAGIRFRHTALAV